MPILMTQTGDSVTVAKKLREKSSKCPDKEIISNKQ